VIRLLRAALFLEFGFMLIVVPWSAYWDRNYFAALIPQFHALIVNNFVRGAVSGIGVINIVAAVSELVAVYVTREAPHRVSIHSSHPAED
jgi:ABC-type transport system involved in cytochrome c biogenesis permease subunit